jgi:hypothetical protein
LPLAALGERAKDSTGRLIAVLVRLFAEVLGKKTAMRCFWLLSLAALAFKG